MKNLSEYVKESFDIAETDVEEIVESETPESKEFTFDFTDLDNADDIIKTLQENDAISVDGKKVTLTVKKDDKNVESAMEEIRKYTETIRSSSRRASDEKYAQETVKFAKVTADVDAFINELNSQEAESESDDKKKKEEE